MNGALLTVASVVGAGAVAYLVTRQPGASVSTLTQRAGGVLGASIDPTEEQALMTALIRAEFIRANLGAFWRPAVANAYAESLLNPRAEGDGGRSVGLFQLHIGGAGAGMTADQRRDPVSNTRRIIRETVDQGGRAFLASGSGGARALATNAQLTDWFASNVENCLHCGGPASVRFGGSDSDLARRRSIFERLFPGVSLLAIATQD